MTKLSKIIAIGLLFLGLLIGLVAVFGGKKPVKNLPVVVNKTEAPKFSIVKANKDLAAGHILQMQDLDIEKVEVKSAKGFDTKEAVVGRTIAKDIESGTALAHGMLLEGVSGLLAAGQRAISIKVDEASAVGHQVKPGDWVDVFVLLKREGEDVGATHSRLLLPRKQVLAYGAELQDIAKPELTEEEQKASDSKDRAKPQGNERRAAARTAVLAVQVEEVNRLLLAEQYGQVQLALRSPLDHFEPSADMLKQIAGLSLALEDLDAKAAGTKALDRSLAAMTLQDIAKVPGMKLQKVSQHMPEAEPESQGRRSAAERSGAQRYAVEVIRGTRKETQNY